MEGSQNRIWQGIQYQLIGDTYWKFSRGFAAYGLFLNEIQLQVSDLLQFVRNKYSAT